jgi:hypothetical protein
MPAITDAHVEALKLLWQLRMEPQNISRDVDTRRYALHQIDDVRHGAEMHALHGSALLHIAHVALPLHWARRPAAPGVQEVLILAIVQPVPGLHAGVVFECAHRQLDATRLEEGCHTVVRWLTVDGALVVGVDVKGDERVANVSGTSLEKPVEQPFSGRGMHACCFGQHVVEVEQHGLVILRRERDNGSYAGHDPSPGSLLLSAP